MANEEGRAQIGKQVASVACVVALRRITSAVPGASSLEKAPGRVRVPFRLSTVRTVCVQRVVFLGIGAQTGGRFHPKLNIRLRPIANKYCEGKVKRALKRGLKVPETVRREANGTSSP